MRTLYSYVRLTIASWFFMGGLALQFVPSAAALEREARWREGKLQALPSEQRSRWIEERDIEYGQSEAYLRLFGVLLGGIGFGIALHETAYVCAQYSRQSPTNDR